MPNVLGDLASRHCESDEPLDVPTMMKMLMIVYESLHEDDIMGEVTEAVGDAICMLGDMRKIAQQVISEGGLAEDDVTAEFNRMIGRPNECKLC